MLDICLCNTSSPSDVKWPIDAVQVITLSLAESPESWITSVDWATFSHIAAFLPCLETVTVEVKEPGDSEQLTAYMLHAHAYLETLSRTRGIKLNMPEC